MHSMYGARGHVHGNESGPRGPGSVILATILVKLSMALMRATFHKISSHRSMVLSVLFGVQSLGHMMC